MTPILPGTYLLRQTEVPQFGSPAADGEFTLAAAQVKDLFVETEVLGFNGTFRLSAIETDLDPVEDACFTVEVDGGPSDGIQVVSDSCSFSSGVVAEKTVPPGDYRVTVTFTPGTFRTPDSFQFTVESGKTNFVVVEFEEAEVDDPGDLIVKRLVDNTDDDFVVTGACFTLFENDNGERGNAVTPEVCDDDDGDDDGLTHFNDTDPGTYIIGETTTPVGSDTPTDGLVTIKAGQTKLILIGTSVIGVNGQFDLHAEDESGDPVPNACFEVYEDLGGGVLGQLIVGGVDLCSDGNGSVLLRNQLPGDFVVFTVVTPDGFKTPADKKFSVAERELTDVPVVFEEADENDPGSILIRKKDNTGAPLARACFRLFTNAGGGARGSSASSLFCDNKDGTNDGLITMTNIAPGTYVLGEVTVPDGFVAAADQLVTVKPGQRLVLSITNQLPINQFEGFALTAHKTNGDPLEGACFEVYEDAGGGALGELIVGGTGLCSDASGHVLSRNQEPGHYVTFVVTTPDGFATPANKRFQVVADTTTEVDIKFRTASPNEAGSILITKKDNHGDLLVKACFKLFTNAGNGVRGSGVTGTICDNKDGTNDGSISITSVAPGTYVLAETIAPDGFQAAVDQVVTVKPGQRLLVTVVNSPPINQFEGFVLTAEDADGDPVEGACFEIYEDAGGGQLGELIVGGTGLCSDAGGHVLSRNQESGHYVSFVVTTPDGFRTPANKRFQVLDDETTEVAVVFRAAGANELGTLLIRKEDAITQELLTGSCFQAFKDAGSGERGASASGTVCDDDDGFDDGRILVTALPAGSYVLGEITAPDGYGIGFDQTFKIKAGQRSQITIRDLESGPVEPQFALTAEDSNGDPVEGACFEVYEDAGDGELGELIVGGVGLCSEADGHVLTRFQDPGKYVAHVVTTPDGFETPDDVLFTVEDGKSTAVPVVFLTPEEVDEAEGGDDEDDEDDVTQLPSTGTGHESRSTELLMLALLGLTVLSAGYSFRRRMM
jgi:uncharacterized surface anchored protein